MKFIAFAIATLATYATASPEASGKTTKCKPGTFRCQSSPNGWEVCNSTGEWIFAGACPVKSQCKFNKENGSPYCLLRGYEAVKVADDEI